MLSPQHQALSSSFTTTTEASLSSSTFEPVGNLFALKGFEKCRLTTAGRPMYASELKEIENMIVVGIALIDNNGKEMKDFNHVYLSTHRIYFLSHAESSGNNGVSYDYGLSCSLSIVERVEKEGGGLFRSPKTKILIKSKDVTGEIVISFRKGKRDEFVECINEQLKKKKWLESLPTVSSTPLFTTPTITSSSLGSMVSASTDSLESMSKKPKNFQTSTAGIAGIMKRIDEENLEERKELDEAFSDLKKLMEKAEDMVNLAESFKNKIVQRNKSVTHNNTAEENEEENQMLDFLLNLGLSSPVTKQSSGAQYHQQLARQLVDFLDNIVQERYGGVITLTDAFCLYNRARGTALISPEDMQIACSLFEKLKLPMKLRTFESGVVVIQSSRYSDTLMANKIESFIREGREKDAMSYCYITAVTLARLLNISAILAKELLLSAEAAKKLCRDENEEGIRFYLVSDVFDPFVNY
ncbi:hypothetical protein C9374_003636 [Naegleria lovaniensis]|uniref:Vacuolar protein-sorting-associated protein 36 n=1 Tax=Naegleria lovaniensis TaxID=51637 RepID=A0AA88KHD2_NAELO|nr:uncharacterized protein C9374_014280 [Naegleria lovaniensis]XP_044541902.1 uncharacterized protein C9374_013628 [Naegleria lovaniensis]XP_044555766.1 uncharacterized protein C9374_003636 [Naegleria lovaniensis]KAG2370738.1 hypothetical protein C9374_014280 [Naegleria lovaniensis]KAG2372727.1 hypothetical protein C9374_013628 [Naegleria lovaniensis]KAG2393872.1 hypothetical protein C9374_003636 [Naegleria lovaniensis]